MFVLALIVIVAGFVIGQQKKSDKVTIDLEGIKCQSCVSKIETTLHGIEGVEKAEVNLEKKQAVVTLAANGKVKPEVLVKAVSDAGYGAKVGNHMAAPSEHAKERDCSSEKSECSTDAKEKKEKSSCCSTKEG